MPPPHPVRSVARRWRILAVGMLLAGLGLGAADPADEEPGGSRASRSRQLGDKAFADGMYSLAVRFYRQSKEETAGADRPALLEACLRLAGAQVRAGNAPAAREELSATERDFLAELAASSELRQRLACHWGEIQLLEGDAAGAAERLEALVREMPAQGDTYLQALDLLGTAQARQTAWDAAEKTYALLEFAARGTPLAEAARSKKMLAMIMSGALPKARSLLGPDAASPARERRHENLLSCILLTREGKLAEARQLYQALRPMAGGPDVLWYLTVRGLADAAHAAGLSDEGVDLLLDAAHFAVSEGDRQQAFRDAINGRVALGNRAGAAELCERFLRDYPEAADAAAVRLQLARLGAALDRTDDALQAFAKVQDAAAVALDLRLQAARESGKLLINRRRYEEAKARFDFLAANAPDDATRGEGFYWLAELLFLQGRTEEAAAAFQAVARDHPGWREKAMFQEAQVRIQLKEYPLALAQLQLFIRQFRESSLYPDALFHLARVRQFGGEFGEAREGFAKFAAAFPEHPYAPRAWFEAGELSFGVGDYLAAAEAYTALVKIYPRHLIVPNALYRRVFARAAAGDDEGACHDADTLIHDHADSLYSVHARYWLADRARDRRDFAAAEKILREIAARPSHPAESAQALYEAAETSFAAGRPDDAIRHLDELNEKFPEAPVGSEGQLLRGNIHMSRNEFQKAMPFFRKAAERRPDSPLAVAAKGRLGDSYYSLAWETPTGANTQEALKLYREVTGVKDLPPGAREQALYKAGRCEEDLGDQGAALARYLETVYSYEADAESGYRRDPFWFAKAALAAARLYLAKDTPEAAETAISIYRRLVRLGIEPVADFQRQIEEIREQHRLKE